MISLLCVDVDGTLTNGNIFFGNLGEVRQDSGIVEFIKVFNAKDGLGLAYWHSIGRKVAIITGKSNEILLHRAKELRIDFVFMDIKDKGEVVRKLKKELSLDSSQVAAIGDDLNDISMFKESNLNFAPNDCASGIRDFANVILNAKGGKGAVREAIEFILKKEQIYDSFIQSFA